MQGTENWRDAKGSYANASRCVIGPGLSNLSICWFSQGRGVSGIHALTDKLVDNSGIIYLAIERHTLSICFPHGIAEQPGRPSVA